MMATGSSSGNRLAGAVSPYLLSHAHQEVDWYPWGQEAFDEAKRRDVPLLISIGYRTCHWCHVMSRECFDNPGIASLINDTVVAVKVDREEHGDVDATYLMQAGAFTKNLGWPLTVFAHPPVKRSTPRRTFPPNLAILSLVARGAPRGFHRVERQPRGRPHSVPQPGGGAGRRTGGDGRPTLLCP